MKYSSRNKAGHCEPGHSKPGRNKLGLTVSLASVLGVVAFCTGHQSAAQPASTNATSCPGGNVGLSLPDGFCATVFADKLGHVRHMVVAPDGVLYANTWSGRYFHNDAIPAGGFLLALKDTKNTGHADQVVRFGPAQSEGNAGGTGITIYQGHIYAETNDKIVRYRLPTNGLMPMGAAEVVVSGMPLTGDHPMHPMAIDPQGHMYVDMGSATNSCQSQNRMPNVPGNKPCTELETRAGTWRFDANKLDQRFSASARYATGIRNGEGISFDSAGRTFVTQHGRDQLFQNWGSMYTAEQSAAEPAEELVQLQQGGDYGWPECYYDYDQKKLVLAPEYGGDGGKKVDVCAHKLAPVAAFPGHWAPNDMLIYEGKQFPTAYKDGAFIAFHGSWNRAPLPQGGYNVVFQPLHDGKASAPFVVFADGFAEGHLEPGRAAHRPTGLAVGPDGALYIADDQGGRIWRVTYRGGNAGAPIAAAAVSTAAAGMAAASAVPPEGTHPTAGLPVPPGGSPDQVALGSDIFHGKVDGGACTGCHGSDAKGGPTGSNLTEGKFLWSDGSVAGIAKTIEQGVAKPKNHIGAMPPYGGARLSQADVTAVANYVWAISHPNGH
jgi:glucose/arabinose dehydrogenase/cytochrome c5